MNGQPLPQFRAGQILKAEDLQRLVLAIVEGRIQVAEPLTLQRTAAGVLIGYGGEPAAVLVKPTTSTADGDGYYTAKVRILTSAGIVDWADCKVMVPT